jgi:hypothetical protein
MTWELQSAQRSLTIDFIRRRRLNVPVVWLKAGGTVAFDGGLDTDLSLWENQTEERNLGVRLVDGWLELKIQAPDDVWAGCLLEACQHLRVDTRAAYGPSGGRVTSVILRVTDPAQPALWGVLWPKGFIDPSDQWVATKFTASLDQTKTAKAIFRESSPLPGSSLAGAVVVWRPNGKPAAVYPDDLEAREIAATNMESICRAIAYGTLLYWIRAARDDDAWDDSLTRIVGGWLARVVQEGAGINARGKSLEGACWSPVDDRLTAGELILFLQKHGRAPGELGHVFMRAEAELERSQPVAGWSALERALSAQAKVAIRRAFRAGIDIDVIEAMSERYAFDRSTNIYFDRENIIKGLPYQRKLDEMAQVWENEPVFVGKKKINPFRLYAASSLRLDVEQSEFFPDRAPAAILRFSPVHGLLDGEQRRPDEYKLLNIFPGFPIKAIGTVDQAVMARAITMLDRMLGLLTQDNDAQILWLKQNTAWTLQHPAEKQQVSPILIGGQGIGKSLYGNDLQKALFGGLACHMNSGAMKDNRFVVAPFVGKLVTFLDEVRFNSPNSINDIKNIIRSVRISGEVKFSDRRDYNIWSRAILASNNPDIGLSPEDAADRAFFFIVGHSAETKRMSTKEFLDWAVGLKPFYNEFAKALNDVCVKQHLVRYFLDLECTRAGLEDLTHSSRSDAMVIKATMSKACAIAREIIADARVHRDRDIVAWFNMTTLREAIKQVDGDRTKIEADRVMAEYEHAGVIESAGRGYYKFKWGYGRLLEKMGQANGLPITPNWEISPVGEDWSENETRSPIGGAPWRGKKQEGSRRGYDSDYMGPE